MPYSPFNIPSNVSPLQEKSSLPTVNIRRYC